MHVGEKIKEIRRHLGLSQENIARDLCCSVATISRIERGQAECGSDMLRAFKAAMGVEAAPLTDAEIATYRERLYIWEQLMADRRMSDARDLGQELSVILKLPHERDLILLYEIFEVKMLLAEGDFDNSYKKLDILEKSFKAISPEHHFHYYRARSTLYFREDDGEQALKFGLKALELKEDCRNLASLYYSIAVNYSMLNRPFAAIMYLEEARRHHNDDMLSVLGVFIDHVLPDSYLKIGEFSRAKPLLDAALLRAESIGRKLGRKKYIGMILHLLGIYYGKMGDAEQALDYFDRAFEYFWKGGPDYRENYYHKTRCLIVMRRYIEAKDMIEQALITDNNEKFTVLCNSLLHLMTLREIASQNYLEHCAIPYLVDKSEYFITLDFCEQLEEQYKKSGNGKKSLEIAVTARDVYAKIIFGQSQI